MVSLGEKLRQASMSDSPVDVAASCDSTWQKQGHSSLYGVASLPLRQFLIMKSKAVYVL